MASLLQRNTFIHRRFCVSNSNLSCNLPMSPIAKFPINSRSIYQFTTQSLHRPLLVAQPTSNPSFGIYHIPCRNASAVTKTPKKRNSTPNALNAWGLSYNTRSTLRWLGYWSPRIVIMAWAFTFVCSGAYLLKKSIDTDGFSTQFSPGNG